MGRIEGWPYDQHKATIEFQVIEHEDTLRRPRMAIKQDLTITWDNDRKCWHAVGHMETWNPETETYDAVPAEDGGHTWHGYAETRIGAVLDWIAARADLKETI